MQEFDYRVFDEKKKTYMTECVLSKNEKGEAGVLEPIVYGNHLQGILKDRQVELYTGCKDKHGRKIYEGDIVLLSDRYDYPICHVSFRKGSFTFEVRDRENAFLTVSSYTTYDCEIIGNINTDTKNP